MSVRGASTKPAEQERVSRKGTSSGAGGKAREPAGADRGGAAGGSGRYRRLPTGAHGLDPEEVRRDQRERLQTALIELIAARGYQAVRILDLTKLARVSRPTFYSLYADKEELFLAAYDEIAKRTASTIMAAYQTQGSPGERLRRAMRAFAELAAAEPEAVSLMVLGAFGAGPKALERRNRTLQALEQSIASSRSAGQSATGARGGAAQKHHRKGAGADATDLTVKVILGGIREVTAARLRRGQAGTLPGLADELAAWAASYPSKLAGRAGTANRDGAAWKRQGSRRGRRGGRDGLLPASERARQAEGRLPSGRHDLPRQFIVKNQRERIVDATAAIVAEKGLAALTIPEIARRANVSHQTFYEMYPSKDDAFLGAQKVGLHQALGIAVRAYEAQGEDWPMGVSAGMQGAARLSRLRARARAPDGRRHVRGQPAGDRNPRNRPARVRRVPAARLPLRAVRALRPWHRARGDRGGHLAGAAQPHRTRARAGHRRPGAPAHIRRAGPVHRRQGGRTDRAQAAGLRRQRVGGPAVAVGPHNRPAIA